MKRPNWFISTAAALLIWLPASAYAHVSVWPRESTAGATEKYIVRVPAEGKVASKSVELEVPEGVLVEVLSVPSGWKQEVKRDGNRIIAITWLMDIKAGEFQEFTFIARNPKDKTQIVWKLRQNFADGTSVDMTNTPTGVRPNATTKLAPMKTL